MIVITGASDGLGKEVAALYLAAGKRVVGLSRGACADGVEHIATDLTDAAQITAATEQINADPEPLEAFINCAGILSREQLDRLTAEAVGRLLDINLKAPMILTSGLMAKIKRDGADVVYVSSTYGLKAGPDESAYTASKWGLRGYCASVQQELKEFPSRVISFCPGAFDTKIYVKATGQDNSATKGPLMAPSNVARCLKQLLDLPKNMEVSEVVINRKQVRQFA